MAQVSVRVNGREYNLACADGEEAHLRKLAHYVDSKITALRGSGTSLADAQLLLMAGIVISDELTEATQSSGNSGPKGLIDQLEAASSQLEALTARLEAS
jgi:cell division protein ZapA